MFFHNLLSTFLIREMSLAYFAASFDDDSNITLPNSNTNSTDILNQKRHKKTQRKYSKIEHFDNNKVNSVLQQIHNKHEDDEEDNAVDQFNPPPKPESRTHTEAFHGLLGKTAGKPPMPNYEGSDNLDLNDYGNYGDSRTNEEYYKKVMPGFDPRQQHATNSGNSVNRPYYNYATTNTGTQDDVLIQKLNYMISLLEEQQDEKTNNVTEEVILYSFLGIFIIFIADTFVRAGKYTR